MARELSTETKLRNALRELKQLRLEDWKRQNDLNSYRARTSKAETEVAEWKKRFDALLARTPKVEVE